MPKKQVGDVEIYYEEYGDGVPIVLLHGLAGDCSAWNPQINVLKEDYKVVPLDNRGAGRSCKIGLRRCFLERYRIALFFSRDNGLCPMWPISHCEFHCRAATDRARIEINPACRVQSP